ncbi:conserved hypothetical protein [Sporisorium reilianum SRZ2]|uniref:Uncharacterized protein n=1 Tax=Sporisorium reilianum (strain SRZ2) TaxID=999809 RepID=E6ZYN5_SPORE|nr:conserved hypothetical protein [Sporisorium reilianum SRZ2]
MAAVAQHYQGPRTPDPAFQPRTFGWFDTFASSPDHGETYASTASFLLRLLVDDRHVCLVAVARPIPEPAAPLPAAADLVHARSSADVPASPGDVSSGALSPAARGLQSLHLAPAAEGEDRDQDDDSSMDAASSMSSSPHAASSVFSSAAVGKDGLVAPLAPHTRMVSPRAPDGRINNTPATSVFSDIFAERGHPVRKFTLDDLPGPDASSSPQAPVKTVLSVPPPRVRGAEAQPVESETILGVVSAQLSVVAAPSEDSFFAEEEVGNLIDVHLLTLATAPEERGQGLGAKLLAALHGECMAKARLMAMKVRSKRGGAAGKLPVVGALSPKFVDDAAVTGKSAVLQTLGAGVTLTSLRDARSSAPQGKYMARTFLEVHPSNVHALSLYRAHGFAAPLDDAKAIKRGFYRGDVRIATSERTKRGGTDAWVLQRFDGPLVNQ